MRVVVAVAVALFAAGPVAAQSRQDAPACRAARNGDEIVTRIVYPDGYAVEGPWRVKASRSGVSSSLTLTAILRNIVEIPANSAERRSTPLRSAIEMTFTGESIDDVLTEAAHVWCVTVMRVRPTDRVKPGAGIPERIT